MSHGAFPWLGNKLEWTDKNRCELNEKYTAETRWSDFMTFNDDNLRSGERGGHGELVYGSKHVYTFLEREEINFIIRGHADDDSNSYLFSNIDKQNGYKNGNFDISKQEVIDNNNEVIFYDQDNKKNTKGPIARIVCDKNEFLKNNINVTYANAKYKTIMNERIDKNNVELYPVLTIATNTDIAKPLSADSFALLRFDIKNSEKKDFTKNILESNSEFPDMC